MIMIQHSSVKWWHIYVGSSELLAISRKSATRNEDCRAVVQDRSHAYWNTFCLHDYGWSLIWGMPSLSPSRLQMAHNTKQLYVSNYVVTVIIFFCNLSSNIGIYKYIPHGSIWINLCCVRRSINHLFDLVYHLVFLNIVLNGDSNDCLYNTLWQSSQLLLFCC